MSVKFQAQMKFVIWPSCSVSSVAFQHLGLATFQLSLGIRLFHVYLLLKLPIEESSCYIQLQTVSSSKHQASLVTPFWPQERTSQHLLFETQPFDLVERGFFPPRTRSSFSISARFLHSQRSVHVLTWLWQKNLHHHHHRPTKNIVRQCTPLNFQPSRLFTTSRL